MMMTEKIKGNDTTQILCHVMTDRWKKKIWYSKNI